MKKYICAAAVIATLALAGCSSTAKDATPAVEEEQVANTVTYEVTSDGPTASSVIYMTLNNGGTGQEQATDAALPFTKELTLEDGGAFSTNVFSLVAQAAEGATTISCKITAKGEVIAEQTSTGEYAVVSCSGSSK